MQETAARRMWRRCPRADFDFLLSSWVGIDRTQLFGSLFRKNRVEVRFLDAVGLATLFDDGKNFDVPVKVVGQSFPIAGELAFFAERAGRGVHHKVKRW